jgi:hypothetical protein
MCSVPKHKASDTTAPATHTHTQTHTHTHRTIQRTTNEDAHLTQPHGGPERQGGRAARGSRRQASANAHLRSACSWRPLAGAYHRQAGAMGCTTAGTHATPTGTLHQRNANTPNTQLKMQLQWTQHHQHAARDNGDSMRAMAAQARPHTRPRDSSGAPLSTTITLLCTTHQHTPAHTLRHTNCHTHAHTHTHTHTQNRTRARAASAT